MSSFTSLIFVIIAVIVLVSGLKLWTDLEQETVELYPSIKCLQGHQYYFLLGAYSRALAPVYINGKVAECIE